MTEVEELELVIRELVRDDPMGAPYFLTDCVNHVAVLSGATSLGLYNAIHLASLIEAGEKDLEDSLVEEVMGGMVGLVQEAPPFLRARERAWQLQTLRERVTA